MLRWCAEYLIFRPHQEEHHSGSLHVQNSPPHPITCCTRTSRYSSHISQLALDPFNFLFISIYRYIFSNSSTSSLQLLTRTVAWKTPTTQPIRETHSTTTSDTPRPTVRRGPSCPATSTRWRSEAAAGRSQTWTVWKCLNKELQGEQQETHTEHAGVDKIQHTYTQKKTCQEQKKGF